MTAKIYQNELFPKMERVFAELEVKNEWAAFSGRIHQYSPRIDLAIGGDYSKSGHCFRLKVVTWLVLSDFKACLKLNVVLYLRQLQRSAKALKNGFFLESVLLEFFVCRFLDVILP